MAAAANPFAALERETLCQFAKTLGIKIQSGFGDFTSDWTHTAVTPPQVAAILAGALEMMHVETPHSAISEPGLEALQRAVEATGYPIPSVTIAGAEITLIYEANDGSPKTKTIDNPSYQSEGGMFSVSTTCRDGGGIKPDSFQTEAGNAFF